MMDAVLLVIGDAAEVLDTLYPYYRLQEDGIACVTVGPEAREYQLVVHSQHEGWDITVESAGYRLRAVKSFNEIDANEYLGLVISGGRAPEYLRYNEDLMRITRHMAERAKPIATICHGVEIMAAANVIRGKRIATVAKCRYDVEGAGAVYVDTGVAIDGNIISARDYHSCGSWMREFTEALEKYRTESIDS